MKETFYFSHDYTASTDPKVEKMIFELGWESYGVYWAIIEKLALASEPLDKDYKILTFLLHLESKPDLIKKIVEEYGLFSEIDDKFFSKRLNDHLEKRKTLSDAGKRGAAASLATRQAKGRLKATPLAVKERKVKESKGKVMGPASPTPSQKTVEFFDSVKNNGELFSRVVVWIVDKYGYNEETAKQEIFKFTNYWTELTPGGKKERWETEKTFEVNKRMGTWFGNKDKFSKPSFTKPNGSICPV